MATNANIPALLPKLSQSGFQINAVTIAATFVLCVAGFVVFTLYGPNVSDRPYPGFTEIGKEGVNTTAEAKAKWVRSAKSLIYDTLKATGRPFQVLASTGPLIILPAHHMDEVRNDDRMTFGAFLQQAFFTTYPGFEGFRPAVDNDVFNTSVRIGLTQAIGQVTEILSQETHSTLEDLLPRSPEWKASNFSVDALKAIGRLSSRIFLPEPLCHDPAWLKIAVDYTVDFFAAAYALRLVPVMFRPIVHWFLPQCKKVREDVRIATAIIQPEVDARRKRYDEAEARGEKVEKPVDALTWLDVAARNKGYPDYNIVWGQLNYSLGAIHTTAITYMNVTYDLIDHSEYIPLLREEIVASGWKLGQKLEKDTLHKLKLMDSFMKESQRLSPVTLIPINRVAHENVTLSDGTQIPKDAVLGIPITAMTDDKVYDKALEFDGHRFYNFRQQPGKESQFQFVTTSNNHIAFGHGKHACPGRFFASNEIKILLVHMLSKYDFKFPEGQGKPKPLEIGVSMAPNPKMQILYRERQT